LDAILYQARTGCQWRYLPAEFGRWNTVLRILGEDVLPLA